MIVDVVKCNMECVVQRKKVMVQFGTDQQFTKPVEINELKSVNEISHDIAQAFTIKKEFMDDFSLKENSERWLIPGMTLREQGFKFGDKSKIQLAKKYNFTFDLLKEKDLKLNTITLTLTYNEVRDLIS